MSDIFVAPAKPRVATLAGPAALSSADKRVFAQVEKWMETIRELAREPIRPVAR